MHHQNLTPGLVHSQHHCIVSVTFVGLLVIHCICGHNLTILPLHTLPYCPQSKQSPCPLSQLKTIWLGLPLSIKWARGGKPYDWRAAAPNLFVCVLTTTCTMHHQNLTPGLVHSQHPCMQPHFTPTSSPPTPLHLIAISILAINSLSGVYRWAPPQCSRRTVRPSTSTEPTLLTLANTQPPHALTKYTKEPWLYPPPPLTKECSSVGRA